MDKKPTPEELRKRYEEAVEQSIAAFPYQRIEVEGTEALATWEALCLTHAGSSPVVVGGVEDFKRIVEGATAWPGGPAHRTPAQIIEIADRLHHPEDLYRQHERDAAEMRERIEQLKREKPDLTPPPKFQLPDSLKEALESFGGKFSQASGDDMIESTRPWGEPRIGEWPTEPMGAPELSVATETLTGAPLEKVQILILPTDDSSKIPAYLHWGHWNGCPAPEYHIAALRSWRERFGAELVGLSHDVMNVRVQSKPPTREAALELAREQYVYCSDIVDQGVQTLSALAAVLMESDWWYFWWD
jgi:Domain of unknown function (DUF4253)